jgi:hypothetical protein
MTRVVIRILIAVIIAAAATAGLAWTWVAIGGGALSIHGWIALTAGVVGTAGLAWGLMALAFRSDREGWDDRVDTRVDPGRDD